MIATTTPVHTLTLAELESKKLEYLIEGNSLVEDLMTVVREMGAAVVERSRPLIRLTEGDIQAIYYDHAGSYLPAKGQYSRSTSISVWVKGDQVCSLTTTNDPYHVANARDWNIFIPGNWVRVLTAHLAEAKRRAANREAYQLEQKRQELERRLLIGKSV
jgi:hypothetical protein